MTIDVRAVAVVVGTTEVMAHPVLDAARRDRLQGKDLASALGFKPHYLVASVSRPRDGHCYKTIRGLVPRG